jgi:benzoyl-CoA reductase subunit C
MNGELKDLLHRHKEIAREEKEKSGRLVFGTLCSYVPVEILHAFDILPVRLWGNGKNPERADALLPTYICPPARNIMAMGLAGDYDFLDGVIHSYTCDATCGLFNIWCRNLKPAFSFMLSPPYMNTDEAVAYCIAEFKALITAIEGFTGKRFSAERLRKSIDLYNAARERIGAIYRANQNGAAVRYLDLYQMNLALQVLPIERVLPFYDAYLSNIKQLTPRKNGKHRIMISGSVVSKHSAERSLRTTPAWAIGWYGRGFPRGETPCRRWPAIISIARHAVRGPISRRGGSIFGRRSLTLA